jgi:ArsR family transcriptional regulator, arsenate/arsenite/antimonite-responsive transcriptional repressor
LSATLSPIIGGIVIRKRTSLSHSTRDVEQLARAFKALSNPNRLSIYLEVLRQYRTEMKSCGLSHLIDSLAIGAPTISHHTKELVDAGLISVQRDGRFIRCTLNDEMRDKLSAFFGKDSE